MLENAIKIFKLEQGKYNAEDIKQCYRVLAKKNHPDKGGSTEMMQLINNAYSEFVEYFKSNELLEIGAEPSYKNIDFIDTIKTMAGVVIEVCGCWVWLSGATYNYKQTISELGFKYSKSKQSWYWSPTIDKLKKRMGTSSMSKIRGKYGSTIINTEAQQKIGSSI